MASSDVFPQSNLNPDAVPWGRAIENAARQNSYDLENVRLAALGDNRASAGQMGVVGRNIESIALQQDQIQAQVDELGSRSSGSVTAADLSVLAGNPSHNSATRSIVVPGEAGGARTNILTFSANGAYSGSGSTSVLMKITQGSTLLFTGSIPASGAELPTDWEIQENGSFIFPIATAGTTFVLTLYALNFQPSLPTTVTLSNITMSYVRADKV